MNLTIFSVQQLWPLTILVGVAVIIPILLSIFKIKFIPSLVIEIIMGIILSIIPLTRNIFSTSEGSVTTLSTLPEGLYILGMSILLFMSGFDTDFSVFKRRKKDEPKYLNVLLCSLIIYILVVGLSIGGAYLLKDYVKGNQIIGIAIIAVFFSSTFASLVIPLVHNYDLKDTSLGKIISTYSTISEFCSIIALSVIMLLLGVSKDPSYIAVIAIVCVYILIFIVKKFIKVDKIFGKRLEGIVHLSTRITVFVLLLAILLSDLGGVEYILGAFLSGMIIRLLWEDHHANKLESIGYGLFVPLFYILVGFKVGLLVMHTGTANFFSLNTLLLFIVILSMMFIVRIPFLYLLRYYKVKTVVSSLLVTTSTIIVSLAIEHISAETSLLDERIVTIFIIASIISCVIPPILFGNSDDFSEARLKHKDYIIELSDFELEKVEVENEK